MEQKKKCMEGVDTFSDIPTTHLYIKGSTGEPTVKPEPGISDTLFEYLLKENRECNFHHDVSVKKRKRAEKDDGDDTNITADNDMLLNDDVIIDMKEEDTIKPEILMRNYLSIREDDESTSMVDNSNNSLYYCCGCNKHIKDLVVYMQHIKTKHPRKRIKHFNLKPDDYDPDFYCKACERNYKTPSAYRFHLKNAHLIDVTYKSPGIAIAKQESNENGIYCCGCNEYIKDHTLYMKHVRIKHSMKQIKHFNIRPDIDDPNMYCKSCERTYKTVGLFRNHLKSTHRINTRYVEPEAVFAEQDSNENGNYCCGCNKYIKDHTSYLKHIRIKHPLKHIKHFDIKPDIDDPNLHCKACERTYKTMGLFRNHLKSTHLITTRNFESKAVIAEQESNENGTYCCGCNKYIKGHMLYLKHITTKHSKKRIKHFNIRPDVDDPNLYCKSCERTYTTVGLFHQHLRQTHKLVSASFEPEIKEQDSNENGIYCCGCNNYVKDHASFMKHVKLQHSAKHIKHFNMRPDVNNPDNYCNACERTYENIGFYRAHLKQTHNIIQTSVIPENLKQSSNKLGTYCCGCDTYIKGHSSYLTHIRTEHGLKRIKYFYLKPDMNDPNYYCRSCDRTYDSLKFYQRHLKLTHRLSSVAINQKQISNQKQDPNNLKYYCSVCQRQYIIEEVYKNHLNGFMHKNRAKKQDPNVLTPDPSDPNFYCRSCHKTYLTRLRYMTHIRSVHEAFVRSETYKEALQRKRRNYCYKCRMPFISSKLYDEHVKTHRAELASLTNPEQMQSSESHQLILTRSKTNSIYKTSPNSNDGSSINCQFCEQSFRARNLYTLHLRLDHHLALKHTEPDQSNLENTQTRKRSGLRTEMKSKYDSFTHHDYDKSGIYCQYCDNSFKTANSYHLHQCKTIRGEQRRSQTAQKEKLPDPSDPKNHCKVCKITFSKKSIFRKHCIGKHLMQLAPLPYNRHVNPVVIVRNRSKKKVRFGKSTFVTISNTVEKDLALLPDPSHQMKSKPLRIYHLSNPDA